MTDGQFAVLASILTAGFAGIAAAVRFSATRVVRSLDANSTAMLDNTKSNAVLATKIDGLADYVHRSERARVPTPPLGQRATTSGE